MIKKFKIIFLITGLFLLVSNQKGTGSFQQKKKEIVHTIQLENPVKKEGHLEKYSLVELRDKSGNTYQYYLDVVSVYCIDSVCKVVPVRIFWDIFSRYQHYKLDSRYKLEKEKGKPFSRKDYKKLHTILQDKNSPFRGYSISEMMKTSGGEGVDAITSATTIILPDSATIKGATLTCYTLWHWVYGGVVPIIRDMTGDSKSAEEFVSYLKSEKEDYRYFALQQIIRRNIYDEEILNEALRIAPKSNIQEQKLIVEYFEAAPENVYYSSVEKILALSENGTRVRCLNSLLNTKHVPPANYYEHLGYLISGLTSFQETDLFLSILEKYNVEGSVITNQVMDLIENENILIARRAYWFLEGKNLSETNRKKLDEFYKAKAAYF